MRKLIRKYALRNAFFFDGKADVGAVLGKVFAERPELSKKAKEVQKAAREVVEEVNELSREEQKAELEGIDPDLLEREEKEEEKELPELPEAEKGVVMRFAPNPNGPLHIGHSRQALLNDEYVKRYGGKFILRFDDTDPRTPSKRPLLESYEMIEKDLEWLGVKIDEIKYASSRIPAYMAVFDRLVEMGKGYVCRCDPEKWRELRRGGEACPCRKDGAELWEKMKAGEFSEGEAVARVKTDLDYPDPAARDWAAFRIIDEPDHPRAGNEFILWPMLDFASAVDDHDFGVTHIIRGKDLDISEVRQRFLYGYFGWEYPFAETTGKLFVEGAVTSKSKIKKGMKEGEFSGWDDPQLVTLRALKRRGFPPEAIREFVVDIGLKAVNATLDMGALEVVVKKMIDEGAKRLFFVKNPVAIEVEGAPDVEADLTYYPGSPSLGSRKIETNGRFYICRGDFSPGRVRLKDLYTIKLNEGAEFETEEMDEKDRRSLKKIQWVPQEGSLDAVLLTNKGTSVAGKIEPSAAKLEEGEIVQLERICFARLDDKKKMLFVLTAR